MKKPKRKPKTVTLAEFRRELPKLMRRDDSKAVKLLEGFNQDWLLATRLWKGMDRKLQDLVNAEVLRQQKAREPRPWWKLW